MMILDAISQQVGIINQQNITPKIIHADYFKSGVDADIFKLIDANGKAYALKKSRANFFDNANDINQDDAALFRQEAAFAKLLQQANTILNAPKTIFCHDEFLLMDFIQDDGANIHENTIINLLSQLHQSTKNQNFNFLPISHEGHKNVANALADRMMRRVKNLKTFIDIDFSWLSKNMILTTLNTDKNPTSLLHMDIRRNNLLNNNHKLHLIDWANALIGSPLLELARLEIYNEFKPTLFNNYLQNNPQIYPNQDAYQIYQLDTSIMLNLVFLSSAPNKKQSKHHQTQLHNLIQHFL